MTTHYDSSSGPKEIATMGYFNLKNAHAKLVRDEPFRVEEIEAMGQELAQRDAAREREEQDENDRLRDEAADYKRDEWEARAGLDDDQTDLEDFV